MQWWRDAVVYQIYVRSFADANGDGTGDIDGVRARLPYLRDLGVDALWFSPWYLSPMADGGYDVADYRSIDPRFGTLEQAEALIRDALAMGIRTIVDIVPNHVSDQHPWFRAALDSPDGSAARARFWFRPGRGDGGELPPNGWQSVFGGPAWTRTKDANGTPGEWYLHLFASEQPDLNWTNPDVRREHEDVLRFWFDRGVAGVRIDSAPLLVKDPQLIELREHYQAGEHPFIDRDEVHEIYRQWRAIAESYSPPRVLVGELWLPDAERFARYLRPDELHTAFNFDFLSCPWEPTALRICIVSTLAVHASVDAAATWVLENHDVTRAATRYGRTDSSFSFETRPAATPTDATLGYRRARAAAMLAMALPGSMYIYQGGELGLPEVEDIQPERRQDPIYLRSGATSLGRDGCRVPIPWSGNQRPFGFSPETGTHTWLDQPAEWGRLTVSAQEADANSMLTLYRSALRLRRTHCLGAFGWLAGAPDVLAFTRGESFVCVVNLGAASVALPAGGTVLLASDQLDGGRLPTDSTVWLRLPS